MTRDGACSALLPILFCQLRLSKLHLTHAYGPEPTSCSGGGPVSPRAPRRGTPNTSSRRPGPPPSRGPGPPCDLRISLVHTPALCPGRSGIATRPVIVGARKTLTCRAHGMPLRHVWGTVHPTPMTTPPAGVGRTLARSPGGQGRCPGRPPRPTPYPTVYFPQYSTVVSPRLREKRRLPRSPVHVPVPPCVYKRRRRASLKGVGRWAL